MQLQFIHNMFQGQESDVVMSNFVISGLNYGKNQGKEEGNLEAAHLCDYWKFITWVCLKMKVRYGSTFTLCILELAINMEMVDNAYLQG